MGNRPRKVEKTRIGVTLTRPYLDALDHLVQEGVYMSKGTIILEALRDLFEEHGVEPFVKKEPPKEG